MFFFFFFRCGLYRILVFHVTFIKKYFFENFFQLSKNYQKLTFTNFLAYRTFTVDWVHTKKRRSHCEGPVTLLYSAQIIRNSSLVVELS